MVTYSAPEHKRRQQLLELSSKKGETHRQQEQWQKASLETNWTTQQENALECSVDNTKESPEWQRG